MVITIITFIIVFGVVVFVHELGHFIAAKRSGILVREFAIGMGPKLYYHRKNGTTYTIRMLPVGGYVRMAGEGEEVDLELGMPIAVELNDKNEIIKINTSKKVTLPNSIPLEVTEFDLEENLHITGNLAGNESEPVTYKVDHDATIIEASGTEVQIAPKDVQFQSAKLSRRMLTNFAGPLNNFILSLVLFLFLGVFQGIPTISPYVGEVVKDSVAESAGLKAGDMVQEINGEKVTSAEEVIKIIQSNPEKEVTVQVQRDGKDVSLTMTPKAEKEKGKEVGKIGAAFGGAVTYNKKASLLDRMKSGVDQLVGQVTGIFQAIGSMIANRNIDNLGGPVMIFKQSGVYAKGGVIMVIRYIALISVSLGIMNLMPIPAFDGGKIVLNIIEGVRGKPLSQEKEVFITMIGVVLIIVLMIAVTWKDITTSFM